MLLAPGEYGGIIANSEGMTVSGPLRSYSEGNSGAFQKCIYDGTLEC